MSGVFFYESRRKPKAFQLNVEGEDLFIKKKGKSYLIKSVCDFGTFLCCGIDHYKCRIMTQNDTMRLNFYKKSDICEFYRVVQTMRIPKIGMALNCDALIVTSHANEDDVHMILKNSIVKWKFASLSKSEFDFIKALDKGDGIFRLEYQENRDDCCFHCTQALEKEIVEQAFLKYLNGDTSWQHDFPWERIKD